MNTDVTGAFVQRRNRVRDAVNKCKCDRTLRALEAVLERAAHDGGGAKKNPPKRV
jgi:hypothetical protein